MVFDRGNKKWVSLMLPEHVNALKELYKDQYKQSKPLLDDQKNVELDQTLLEAVTHNSILQITYYEADENEMKQVIGKVHSLDQMDMTMKIVARTKGIHRLAIKDILDLKILSE